MMAAPGMKRDGTPNKKGLRMRVTSGGMPVVKLHYAADARKNPETPQGRRWLLREADKYAGGVENTDWRREMEIEYLAGAGSKLFPAWSEWQYKSEIIVDDDIDLTDAKIYGSYDHGFANPACYLVHAVYPDGLKRTIWEFYAAEVPAHQVAEVILGHDTVLSNGRQFQGNPYAGQEVMRICDPEIDRRTQAMYDGGMKRVIEIFIKAGVHFSKGSRGDDVTVASWLAGNLWLNPLEPMYQICRGCTNLIYELGQLQRQRFRGLHATQKNLPEKIIDKDNHAWDALKYFLLRFPTAPKVKHPFQPVATFDWWKKIAKERKPVGFVYHREMVR